MDEPNRIDFRRQKNIYADSGELFKFFERAAKRTGRTSYSRKSSTRNFFCSGEFEEDIDFENDPRYMSIPAWTPPQETRKKSPKILRLHIEKGSG